MGGNRRKTFRSNRTGASSRDDNYESKQGLLHSPRGRLGQREKKRRALAEIAFGPDTASLGLDEVFDDGEAKAGAALLARARFVHTIKAFKDAFERVGRDARTVVTDEYFNLPRGRDLRADFNSS